MASATARQRLMASATARQSIAIIIWRLVLVPRRLSVRAASFLVVVVAIPPLLVPLIVPKTSASWSMTILYYVVGPKDSLCSTE